MKTWMVRAGGNGRLFDFFQEKNIVALGWGDIGSFENITTRENAIELVRLAYPEYHNQKIAITAGQLFRFANEFEIGDRVVTYDSGARSYLCGNITSEYMFNAETEDDALLNFREVSWSHEFKRDNLSPAARNSLGAISTIFQIPEEFSEELWVQDLELLSKDKATEITEQIVEKIIERVSLDEQVMTLDKLESQSSETIKDKISGFDWSEMQELVAGLLRAMGYRTQVSAPGPDRGRDIVASPDGFGFQDPRIVVEVKHRPKSRMGAGEIRSFLGGRHPQDKGLYVSTGGFSKDAYYEADRANIPLTLMDFELLVDTILEHYKNFDDETRQLLPLKPVYWVID